VYPYPDILIKLIRRSGLPDEIFFSEPSVSAPSSLAGRFYLSLILKMGFITGALYSSVPPSVPAGPLYCNFVAVRPALAPLLLRD